MSDESILTLSQVQAWQRRRGEIEFDMQALQAEAKELERKLDAVRVILGDLPSYPDEALTAQGHDGIASHNLSDEHTSDEMQDHREGAIFSDTVLIAVGRIGGSPRPSEIRDWLRKHGITEVMRARADKPYFYSVLMRHAAKGRLIKDGDGYRLPASSPQGETGGVAPPADSIT